MLLIGSTKPIGLWKSSFILAAVRLSLLPYELFFSLHSYKALLRLFFLKASHYRFYRSVSSPSYDALSSSSIPSDGLFESQTNSSNQVTGVDDYTLWQLHTFASKYVFTSSCKAPHKWPSSPRCCCRDLQRTHQRSLNERCLVAEEDLVSYLELVGYNRKTSCSEKGENLSSIVRANMWTYQPWSVGAKLPYTNICLLKMWRRCPKQRLAETWQGSCRSVHSGPEAVIISKILIQHFSHPEPAEYLVIALPFHTCFIFISRQYDHKSFKYSFYEQVE